MQVAGGIQNPLNLTLSLIVNLVLILAFALQRGSQGINNDGISTLQQPAAGLVASSSTLRSSPPAPASAPYQFKFPPGITKVTIDIGLYSQIIEPQADEWVVGVDASVREIERFKLHSLCESLNRCWLINAAVGSSEDPLITLRQSAREGGSSHINAGASSVWPMDMKSAIVPILSLKTLIDAIPEQYTIPLCKTDTNGNDLMVVTSAFESLRRCERVTMEIVGNHDEVGPRDQYEKAIDVMKSHGLDLAPGKPSGKQDAGSYNLYFARSDVAAHYADHLAEDRQDGPR